MVRPFRRPVNAADLPARHRSAENRFTVKAKDPVSRLGFLSAFASMTPESDVSAVCKGKPESPLY